VKRAIATVCIVAFAPSCRPPDSRRSRSATADATDHAPLAPPSSLRFSPRPNRAREIHWHTFSPETFAEAQRLGRPVLLSVAAIWCHWCHVLDETTLSDPRFIERVNRTTIPVRVDADQNPDIERRYLLGGWPTLALLDARGRSLDGGTYIPAMQALTMIDRVLAVYASDPSHAFEALGGARDAVQDELAPGPLANDDADALTTSLLARLDPVHGGFAGRQKFPMGEVLSFLLDRLEAGDERVRAPLRLWLDGIARGLYDAIDGGFYRYATRADWSAPHFEKMARTNGELIAVFARASRLYANAHDAELARGAWQWAWVTLRQSELFGASQDADEAYSAADAATRRGMRAPYVDPTTLASWNADLAIGGMIAGRVLHDDAVTDRAEGVARAVLRSFVAPDGAVAHIVHDGERTMTGDLSDVAALVDMAMVLAERDDATAVATAQRILGWARPRLAAPDGGWYDRVQNDAAPGLVRARYRDAELNARLAEGIARLARAQQDRALAAEVIQLATAFGRAARRADPVGVRFAHARALVAGLSP
jgi:uncharacterized protein YyaL (SSP411 family)